MADMPASRWRFGQCFGEKDAEEEFSEADILSAVEFDESGDYLATGDKGGRVVVFERSDPGKGRKRRPEWRTAGGSRSGGGEEGKEGMDVERSSSSSAAAAASSSSSSSAAVGGSMAPSGPVEYRFHTEFQSHEAEFDYLKSLEIEEKINQIAWCKRAGSSLMLLSTNDKTIKLWKIAERRVKAVASLNVEVGRYGGRVPVSSLRIPSVIHGEVQTVASCRRVYSNAHAYHVNSISVNPDGATFLSADDLRINLWSLDNAKLSFNVVDIKPPTLEELTEVITSADFHPTEPHTFMFSSSRGAIKVGDMREAALCDKRAKVFEEEEDAASKSYFSEIIASVSDIEFTSDGRYIVARDYLSVKVWDLAMERAPVRVIPVHEYLRPKLSELYESDCIFDKFRVAASGGTGRQILTGSYNSCVKVYDVVTGTETMVELAKARLRPPVVRRIVGGVGVGKGAPGFGGPPSSAAAAASSSSSSSSTSPGAGGGDETMNGGAKKNGGGLMSVEGDGWSGPDGGRGGGGSEGGGGGDGEGAEGDGVDGGDPPPPVNPDELDFGKKVLHYSWHPHEDIIAVAGLNNLYIYHA